MRTLMLALAAILLTGCAAPADVEAKPKTAETTAFPSDIDTEPAEEPEPVVTPEEIPTGSVGDGITVTRDDGAGEITVVKQRNVQPGEYDSKPKSGRYLEVTVLAEATSGTFHINPYDFALVDPDSGEEYDKTCCIGNAGNDLNDRKLRLGQKARGVILFDAPKGALQFSYRGGFSSEDAAVWNVK